MLIVVAEDDASIKYTGINPVETTASPQLAPVTAPPEKFLVVGRSRLGRTGARPLRRSGSSVLVLADRGHLGDVMPEGSMRNIAIEVTSNPEHVEDPASLLSLRLFDYVVLLCYREADPTVAGGRFRRIDHDFELLADLPAIADDRFRSQRARRHETSEGEVAWSPIHGDRFHVELGTFRIEEVVEDRTESNVLREL